MHKFSWIAVMLLAVSAGCSDTSSAPPPAGAEAVGADGKIQPPIASPEDVSKVAKAAKK